MGHKKLVTSDPSAEYPEYLKTAYRRPQNPSADSPIRFTTSNKSNLKDLQALLKKHSEIRVVDNYAEQYAELLLSKNAHLYRANYDVQVSSIAEQLKEHYGDKQAWELGTWVYYPWSDRLVHVLDQTDFEDLRTIRNRDLITNEEQNKLWNFEIACFGMSVGSASAQALAITGISRQIKLIDGAVISGSNLNRIMTGVSSIGQSKAQIIAEQIYEMNPYSDVKTFDKVTKENINEILEKPWPVKLVIDEIDDIEMKVLVRVEARKRRIPVIMATELGDTVMLDVERFDLEPNSPLFHNRIPGIEELAEKKIVNYREWTKHAVNIIDPTNMPVKMQESVLKIGTTIVTHPQLGSTVMITGGVTTFAAKNIALGNRMDSGRYVISLENHLLADHKTRAHKRYHKHHTKIIKKAVSLM